MRKVAFHTLGCKLNYAETSSIQMQLEKQGMQTVSFQSEADVYVINTCSVTHQADKECREIVRRALRSNPDACIVVTGCYAQLKPKEIADIPGVDLVLGAGEKFNLDQHLVSLKHKQKAVSHTCEIDTITEYNSAYSLGNRTRTFLKVQDGCDFPCTYCTIPLARGKSRSASMQDVLKQAKEIANQGVKEIVLTGVNTGDYGLNIDGNTSRIYNLYDLLSALNDDYNVDRIRVSSIEPNLLSKEIVDLVAKSPKLMPHFHIPLQSGSNEILSAMKRRYKAEWYADKIAYIKNTIPHCAIGIDVIVGFPNEKASHFYETYTFLHQLDFSYLHVFTYSPRENTPAYDLPLLHTPVEVKIRSQELRKLSEDKKNAFYKQYNGTQQRVLFESEHDFNTMYGYTENYIRVKHTLNPEFINTIQNVTLQFDVLQAEMLVKSSEASVHLN